MKKKIQLALLGAAAMVAASGCHLDMWVQGKVKPQSKSTLYSDNLGSRLEPVGTVAANEPKLDTEFYTGYTAQGQMVKQFPIKVDEAFIKRGRERYMIFCAPCHGQLGDGNGMIAQRGFKVERPIASYHTDRLRQLPVGHFYSVISNGFGAMYPFGSRIKPRDRWAIAAYIRALQASQQVDPVSLTAEERALMNKPMPKKEEPKKK
jgi:mono/diheme cytochrome c family protein